MRCGVVAAVTRYPIKSVGGFPVTSVQVAGDGIVGDRRFAFVDTSTGQVCSAKNPRRFGRLLACHAGYSDEPAFDAPLPPLEVVFPDGSVGRQDEDLDVRMSDFLGLPVRLIESVPETVTSEIVWDEASGIDAYPNAVRDQAGDYVATYSSAPRSRTSFVDLTPLHLVTTSTLAHFTARAGGPAFDWRRYRPSVLVESAEVGFVEEGWVGGALQATSGLSIEVVMPSPRCIMSTLQHSDDMAEDRSTLRIIAEHNTREVNGFSRGACLGVYADVATPGFLRVGDELDFVEGSPGEIVDRMSRYRSSRRRQAEAE